MEGSAGICVCVYNPFFFLTKAFSDIYFLLYEELWEGYINIYIYIYRYMCVCIILHRFMHVHKIKSKAAVTAVEIQAG